MKKNFPFAGTLTALVLGIGYSLIRKRTRIYFDKDKACENVRPYQVLENYTNTFLKQYNSSNDQITFPKNSFPTTLTYNWDAFAALVNVKKAEKIRIDFGINYDKNLVLCIFPANKKGDIIKTELVKGCPDYGYQQTNGKQQFMGGPLGVMMAAVSRSTDAQGVDDGQRTP